MKQKTKDILAFLLFPLAGVVLSLALPVNALASTLVFFGLPSLYLCVRKPSAIKKALVFASFSLPLMAVVDYVAEITGTWSWPLPDTVFPIKFLGEVSFEVLIWAFLHYFLVVMFYEYFFEHHHIKKLWNKRTVQFVRYHLGIFVGFLVLLFLFPRYLHIPYWYLIFGVVFLVPPVIMEEIKYPRVFLKLLKASVYFVYLNVVYEITALHMGWWSFPSTQFVGWVTLAGVTFPFEEFFFWIVLFTLALLSYYEYFADDEK